MLCWIPEQSERARERGLCQSAVFGSPGTPHTFAIFGQKISLAQTQLCSNYTFLFWEQGDFHGFRPWGSDCQLQRGGGSKYTVLYLLSSPLPLLTLFLSFPVAFFQIFEKKNSFKYFTNFKFVPLRFVEVNEGSDRSYSEDIDLSELSTSAWLLPSYTCQNTYSIPDSPLGAKWEFSGRDSSNLESHPWVDCAVVMRQV